MKNLFMLQVPTDRIKLTHNDTQSFTCIMNRYGPMVLGIARRYVRDKDLCNDIVQTVFLVYWQQAARLHSQDNLTNWFFGVARRIAQRARQQEYRRSTEMRNSNEAQYLSDERVSAIDVLVKHEELQILDSEVAKLPEQEKTVILLCVYQGLTRQQAANRLHCPPGTVAGRLDRARQRLAKRLAKRGITATLLFNFASDISAMPPLPVSLVHTTRQLANVSKNNLPVQVPLSIRQLSQGAIPLVQKPILLFAATFAMLFVCLVGGWAIFDERSGTKHIETKIILAEQPAPAGLDGIWKVTRQLYNGKPETTPAGYGELKAVVIQGKYWRHLYNPCNGTRQFATTFELDQSTTPHRLKMPQRYKWAFLKQESNTLHVTISLVQERWPADLNSDNDTWRIELERVTKLEAALKPTLQQRLLIQTDLRRMQKDSKLLSIQSERLEEAIVLYGDCVRKNAAVPVLDNAAQRFLSATLALCTTVEEKIQALQDHILRLQELEQTRTNRQENTSGLRLQRLETEQQLEELRHSGKK